MLIWEYAKMINIGQMVREYAGDKNAVLVGFGISVIISALSLIILSGTAASFVSNGYHTALAKNAITTSNLATKIKQLEIAKIKELFRTTPVGTSFSGIVVMLTSFPHQTSPSRTFIKFNEVCSSSRISVTGEAHLSIPGIGNGSIHATCDIIDIHDIAFQLLVLEIIIENLPGQTAPAVSQLANQPSSIINIPGIGEGNMGILLFR